MLNKIKIIVQSHGRFEDMGVNIRNLSRLIPLTATAKYFITKTNDQ